MDEIVVGRCTVSTFSAVCVVFPVVEDTASPSKRDIVYSNVSLVAIAVAGDDMDAVVSQANCGHVSMLPLVSLISFYHLQQLEFFVCSHVD